jgi:hypothetical protein
MAEYHLTNRRVDWRSSRARSRVTRSKEISAICRVGVERLRATESWLTLGLGRFSDCLLRIGRLLFAR